MSILDIKNIIIISIMFTSATAYAKDLGTRGHTYNIAEQGFLAMIDQRLQKVDMKKEQEQMIATVKERVANPRAVANINPATQHRVFYFDPTYMLDQDAVLPCGKILHRAGTMVNPLSHMELNRRMFFIDSREQDQVKWLKVQLTNPLPEQMDSVEDKIEDKIEDRIILIGGSPFKLKEELGKNHESKVYFDQGGELTTKFGIKASPTVVVQDGLQLKIEEVFL